MPPVTRLASPPQTGQPPAKRARALSSIVWVGTVSSVLGPNMAVVGKPLGQAIGLNLYAASFLIAAVAMALAGGVVASLLHPEPLQELGRVEKKKTDGFSLSRLRQEKPAYRTALALFCAHIVMVTIMTMTPVHMEHRGSSITLIGITISIHVLGMYASFHPWWVCWQTGLGRCEPSTWVRQPQPWAPDW